MKFYDRVNELARIREFIGIVRKKGSRMLVITGRRRIGKTRLALESVKDTDHLYLFTKKKRVPQLLDDWGDEVRAKYGNVFHGKFAKLEEFLKFLFEFSVENPRVVIFDEVQNFLFTDPSAFGTFQKMFDLYKERSHVLMVFLGSSFSLMNKIFKDKKEPLFGRASDIVNLSYLPLNAQEEILKDHDLYSGGNLLRMFSIFDGVPKYIEELLDMERGGFRENFRALLTQREFFWEEGENLLKEEFGKEYASYYSVLSAISRGRRQLNEIRQFSGINEVGSYLKNLEEIYRMIERKRPLTSRSPRERNGRYYLKDNFMDFWFRFIEPRRTLKELERTGAAFDEIWQELPPYEGRKLEDMVIRRMIGENPLDIPFTRAGKYWDRKGTIELDAVFMDEREQMVYVFEVKTNRKKINESVLAELEKRVAVVPEFKGYTIRMGIAYLEDPGLKIELK